MKLQVDEIMVQREFRGKSREEHRGSDACDSSSTVTKALPTFSQLYLDSRNARSTFRNDYLHRNRAKSSIWLNRQYNTGS